MLVLIAADIDALAAQEESEVEALFSSLLESSIRGHHLILIERPQCEWALRNLSLSGRHKAHLTTLKQKYGEIGGIVTQAQIRLEIVVGASEARRTSDTVFQIGHTHLVEGSFVQNSTMLLLEDIGDDLNFYSLIFEKVKKFSDIPSYCFEELHGGGDRISNVFRSQVCNKRIVVAVSDADRSSPYCQLAETASSLQKVKDEVSNDFIGEIYFSLGRELENYVPYSILKNINHYRGHGALGYLDNVVQQAEPRDLIECFWHYFDIKEGLDGAKLKRKFDEGHIAQEAVDWMSRKLEVSREQLFQMKIPGFGTRVISSFLKDSVSLGEYHKFCSSNYWRSVHLAYFEEILWYFICSRKERL